MRIVETKEDFERLLDEVMDEEDAGGKYYTIGEVEKDIRERDLGKILE